MLFGLKPPLTLCIALKTLSLAYLPVCDVNLLKALFQTVRNDVSGNSGSSPMRSSVFSAYSVLVIELGLD